MHINKERLYELGLIIDKEICLSCSNCIEENGEACCRLMIDLTIDNAIESELICPDLDLVKVLNSMTDEERYSLRHNNISIL